MKTQEKDTDNFFAFRLLRFVCPAHLYEEIEGDLIQKFKKDVKLFGERKLSVKFL